MENEERSMEQNTDLLSYEEAARVLGITVGSLKLVIHRGILHPIKLPGSRRKFLRRSDLDAYRSARPLRLPRGSRNLPTGAELRALFESEHPDLTSVQVQALEVLRTVFAEASSAWSQNAAASKRVAEASQRAAEASQRAAEASQRAAEALAASQETLAANAHAIRDTLAEALRLFVPFVQRRYLNTSTPNTATEQAQREHHEANGQAQAKRMHRTGKKAARALAHDLLAHAAPVDA